MYASVASPAVVEVETVYGFGSEVVTSP